MNPDIMYKNAAIPPSMLREVGFLKCLSNLIPKLVPNIPRRNVAKMDHVAASLDHASQKLPPCQVIQVL